MSIIEIIFVLLENTVASFPLLTFLSRMTFSSRMEGYMMPLLGLIKRLKGIVLENELSGFFVGNGVA